MGTVPSYYYTGTRKWAVHHARMRLSCSLLNSDLCKTIHVVASPSCSCGHGNEDAYHFFRECPHYDATRIRFLEELEAFGAFSIKTILFGAEELSVAQNVDLFNLIQNFIRDSGRFT
jgi:hypothetical protein